MMVFASHDCYTDTAYNYREKVVQGDGIPPEWYMYALSLVPVLVQPVHVRFVLHLA